MNIGEREKRIGQLLFSRRDTVLIKALSGETVPRGGFEKATEAIDADHESTLILLLLAVAGMRTGFDGIREDLIPRLKGVHRYYQVKNGTEALGLRKVFSMLQEAGIDVMLTWDGAVKAGYSPDSPRLMAGYDLCVRASDGAKAEKVLEKAQKKTETPSAEDPPVPALRLHTGVPDRRLFGEDVWDRAQPVALYGYRVFVPSAGDLLLERLLVPYGPYLADERAADRIVRISDCLLLLKGGIDEEAFGKAVERTGNADAAALYFRLFREMDPSLFADGRYEALCRCGAGYGSYLRFLESLLLVKEKERKAGTESGERRGGTALRFTEKALRKAMLGSIARKRK